MQTVALDDSEVHAVDRDRRLAPREPTRGPPENGGALLALADAASALSELNERFAAALHAWWRWLGPAQERVRTWLLGVTAEPPSTADADVFAEAAWLCLRAGDDRV